MTAKKTKTIAKNRKKKIAELFGKASEWRCYTLYSNFDGHVCIDESVELLQQRVLDGDGKLLERLDANGHTEGLQVRVHSNLWFEAGMAGGW